MNLITKKEALIDLHNRLKKQEAETLWEIERISPMSQKEFESFQGENASKKAVEKLLQDKLKERQVNIKSVLELISKEK